MKRLPWLIALCLAVWGPASTWAAGPRSSEVAARHKSGPMTIRGIAHHVGSHGFTLQTTSHGTYTVNAAPPTHVVEKGKSGAATVVEGSHVGVHGYVQGRTIRAIEVRVYPIAPKPVSVRGTISRITGNHIQIRTATGSVSILITSSTAIRTSSAALASSGLRIGDRVEARVVASGHETTALHIHVYRSKAPLKHVHLSGTVLASTSHSMVIKQSGTTYTVALSSTTRYYSGAVRASGSLRTGEQVTVYACCAGQPLVAGSVHIRVQHVIARTTELRGTVVAVSATALRLDTHGAPTVQLQPSTVYEVGAARTTSRGIHPGDAVSVRGQESGGTFRATRVHVYGASRKTATVRGTVAGVSASSIRVIERGAVYIVQIGNGTATHLAGHPIHSSQIHPGDRARAVGHLSGHLLQATSVDLTRPAPKIVTIRGTVTATGASWLVVTQSSGAKQTVRLTSRTQVVFGGRQTSGSAFFPGAHVVARGSRSGAELQASTVTGSASSASETGRLNRVAGRTLLLHRSSGKVVRIDLPAGITPKDGGHAVSLTQLGRGAYLHASGYTELSKALRAVAVTVLHPTLDLRGVLSWQGRTATVRTAGGDSYVALFGRRSAISASRLAGSLRSADIPGGTSVHVVGTVDISGSLAVQTLIARLHSATIRAKIGSMDATGPVVEAAGSEVHVRFIPSTTFFQGSHPLTAGDIVTGDDVTVFGYALSGGTIVARKIAVHRRLLGLDGVVASVTGQSFVLTAADGPHTVLVSATTVVSGTAGTVLAAGMKVHVTGYLRGDGTILATRLHILKAA
jgi:RNase P/RNase MRP subunit p29